jgi:predicted DNA-binding protein
MSMKPETHAVLKALSAKQGRSVASLVNEVLDDFVPAFQHVLDAVDALEKAEGDKRAQIVAQLETAASDLHPLMEDILTRADNAIDGVVKTANETPNPEQENPRDADDARQATDRDPS